MEIKQSNFCTTFYCEVSVKGFNGIDSSFSFTIGPNEYASHLMICDSDTRGQVIYKYVGELRYEKGRFLYIFSF